MLVLSILHPEYNGLTLEGNNKVYKVNTHNKQLRWHEKCLDLDIFVVLGRGMRGLKWNPSKKNLLKVAMLIVVSKTFKVNNGARCHLMLFWYLCC